MASSNGADWFPKVSEGSGKTRRIDANIPEHLYSQLEEGAAEGFRTIPGQLCFVLQDYFLIKTSSLQNSWSGLDCARRDKAGEGGSVTSDNLPLQFFPHQQSVTITAVDSASSSLEPKEQLGKESEETPCKKPKQTGDPYDRKTLKPEQIPDELRHVEDLIIEFWKTKKGSRTSARFQRLINKLSKWDDKDQKAALVAACNNGWGDVFEPKPQASPGSNRFQPPEQRHPQQQIKGTVSPEVAARIEADRAKPAEVSPELAARLKAFKERS